LLLGGQGTAFAHNSKAGGLGAPVKILDLQHEDELILSTDIKIKASFSPYQKQVEKVDPTDSEEEEESQTASKKLSVKKHTVVATHYFSVAFAVPAPENHYSSIKKRTDNFPRFSYSISNRWYILFRVIRI
jgi:hypothetical protein